MSKNRDILPASLPPRGLSRAEAARWCGVGVTLFSAMVLDGRMPKPRLINARTVWDRLELDAAFDALPHEAEVNPWDGVPA